MFVFIVRGSAAPSLRITVRIVDNINVADADARRMASALVRAWEQHCPSFMALDLRDKEVVYRQGESCVYVYYVVSGYLKFAVTDKDGNGVIRAILYAGDLFGALALRTHERTQEDAISKGATRLYRCKAAEFGGLLDVHPHIARYVLANLNGRLAFAHRRTEVILRSPAAARVALLLYELAGAYGGRCRHGHEIDIRLTQQELAELVGVSRPVVSTILNDLRQRQIVSYTRAYICIESMASLKQLLM